LFVGSLFSLDVHLAAVATLGRQGETPGCVGDIGGLDRTTSPRLPELPSDLRLSPFRAPNESPGRVETERKNAMNHEIHETHEKDANRQNQLDSKQPAQSGNAIDDFSPVSGRCSFSCISWFDRFGEGPPTFPGCQKLGGPFGFAPSAVRAVPSRAHIGKRSSLVTRHPPLATRHYRTEMAVPPDGSQDGTIDHEEQAEPSDPSGVSPCQRSAPYPRPNSRADPLISRWSSPTAITKLLMERWWRSRPWESLKPGSHRSCLAGFNDLLQSRNGVGSSVRCSSCSMRPTTSSAGRTSRLSLTIDGRGTVLFPERPPGRSSPSWPSRSSARRTLLAKFSSGSMTTSDLGSGRSGSFIRARSWSWFTFTNLPPASGS